MRTLRAISYLVTPSPKSESDAADERTYTRLLETFQFVLDTMGCTTPASDDKPSKYLLPGGEGWKSCVRVRMLHGVARTRVMSKWLKDGFSGPEIPIAQEDMSGTCVLKLVEHVYSGFTSFFLVSPGFQSFLSSLHPTSTSTRPLRLAKHT